MFNFEKNTPNKPELKEIPKKREKTETTESLIPSQDLQTLRNQEDQRVEKALQEKRSEIMLDTIVKEGGAMLYSTNDEWMQTAIRARERSSERSVQIHDRTINDTFFIMQEKMRINDVKLKQEGINEFVSIEPMIRSEKVVKTRPKKGLFGLVNTTEQYYEEQSRQVNHNEIIKGGENEPAVMLNYEVQDSDLDKTDYMKYFKLGIPLPVSLAEVVANKIKEDPTFIRKIAEEMITKKLGISKMVWEHGVRGDDFMPMKPPYEAWRKNKGFSKIYYQEGLPSKFNPNNVFKF